jgi:hypothetical protein
LKASETHHYERFIGDPKSDVIHLFSDDQPEKEVPKHIYSQFGKLKHKTVIPHIRRTPVNEIVKYANEDALYKNVVLQSCRKVMVKNANTTMTSFRKMFLDLFLSQTSPKSGSFYATNLGCDRKLLETFFSLDDDIAFVRGKVVCVNYAKKKELALYFTRLNNGMISTKQLADQFKKHGIDTFEKEGDTARYLRANSDELEKIVTGIYADKAILQQIVEDEVNEINRILLLLSEGRQQAMTEIDSFMKKRWGIGNPQVFFYITENLSTKKTRS